MESLGVGTGGSGCSVIVESWEAGVQAHRASVPMFQNPRATRKLPPTFNDGRPMSSVILDSTLTCPECGFVKTETMPIDTGGCRSEGLLRFGSRYDGSIVPLRMSRLGDSTPSLYW